MGAMRQIGVVERRARIAVRHHLAPAARAATATDVARNLVGLHATDPASASSRSRPTHRRDRRPRQSSAPCTSTGR